jgi:hypothetical protein
MVPNPLFLQGFLFCATSRIVGLTGGPNLPAPITMPVLSNDAVRGPCGACFYRSSANLPSSGAQHSFEDPVDPQASCGSVRAEYIP